MKATTAQGNFVNDPKVLQFRDRVGDGGWKGERVENLTPVDG